ncbi:MAG: hypothetical protein K6T78_15825 [Alicyclobacillus sp.]|nr:hypothetical protein [Alicyclobacillus sp.]
MATECRVALPSVPTASAWYVTLVSLAEQISHHGHKPTKLRVERTPPALVLVVEDKEAGT